MPFPNRNKSEKGPSIHNHAELDSSKPKSIEEGQEIKNKEKESAKSGRQLRIGFVKIALEYFKYLYSLVLVGFCIVLVMAGIFQKESTATRDFNIHPAAAFLLFGILILWLAMMEGGQGCLVGLQPINKTDYATSHPITLKNTQIAHKGDNMDRFIVGRQFLVVLVIFLINMCGSAVEDADPLGLPNGVNAVFLGNGVALMITTIVLGQLTSQLNAAVCMLDFIDNYFMLFTTYVSLFIEASGLLHAVYPVQIVFAKMSGRSIESFEEPRSALQNIFFWGRVCMSTGILAFALAVTLEALVKGQSGMWEGVPISVSIIIFFLLMCVVGLMDGMQIAAFALINMKEEELKMHKVAFSNCQLMFKGQNLQSFLIGRQVFVAALMFIVAKIATISIKDGENNIFGVPDGFQKFLDTGLLGAVVLTIIGSLIWRIIASSVPLAFMSNPAIYVIIRICLVIEAIGICSAAWVFARIHKPLARYKEDEYYLESEVKLDEEDEEEGYLLHLAAAASSRSVREIGTLPESIRQSFEFILSSDANSRPNLRMSILPPVSFKSQVPTKIKDRKNLTVHGCTFYGNSSFCGSSIETKSLRTISKSIRDFHVP